MIDEFVEFVQNIFPLDTQKGDNVRKALRQFSSQGRSLQYFFTTPFGFLAQGDIIDPIIFTKIEDDGEETSFTTKGLVVSNTCDVENDEQIIIAPMLPLSNFGKLRTALVRNEIMNLLYLPEGNVTDCVADLSLMNAFPSNLIKNYIELGKIRKIESLNQFGYYLFLTKLTIHFMRPEDQAVQVERLEQYKSATMQPKA